MPNNRSSCGQLWGFLFIALMACGGHSDQPSAGTPLGTTSDATSPFGDPPLLTVPHRLALEMLGSNGPELTRTLLAVSRRGHVAFTTGFDPAGRLVTVVDSTGRVLARVGRRGEGPGEFRNIQRLFLDDSTLYVFDGSARLSEFRLDGEHCCTRAIPPTDLPVRLHGDSIDVLVVVDVRPPHTLKRISLATFEGRDLVRADSPELRDLLRSPTDTSRFVLVSYAPKGEGFVLGNGYSHRMVAFDAEGRPQRPLPAFFGRDLPVQRLTGKALKREVERLMAIAKRPFRLPDGTERINSVPKDRLERQAAAAIPYFDWRLGGLQSDAWGRTLAIVPSGDSISIETFDDYESKGRVAVPCGGRSVTASVGGAFMALLCASPPDSDTEVELRLYRLGM